MGCPIYFDRWYPTPKAGWTKSTKLSVELRDNNTSNFDHEIIFANGITPPLSPQPMGPVSSCLLGGLSSHSLRVLDTGLLHAYPISARLIQRIFLHRKTPASVLKDQLALLCLPLSSTIQRMWLVRHRHRFSCDICPSTHLYSHTILPLQEHLINLKKKAVSHSYLKVVQLSLRSVDSRGHWY
jgi:hypothetical protein